MRTCVLALASVLVLIGCQNSRNATNKESFSEAIQKWKAQPNDEKVTEYYKKWNEFNNENKLDEKDACYTKAAGRVQLILLLDETGRVTNVAADVDNAKTRCFQASYMNVLFPPPPFAGFRRYLRMNS